MAIEVLDANGVVQLLRDTSSDLVSVLINGITSADWFKGSQLKASQFADRKILAAETINGQNKILWQVVSTGQIRTWWLDSRWNFVSSNSLTDPTSSAGLLLLGQFMVAATDPPPSTDPRAHRRQPRSHRCQFLPASRSMTRLI